MQVVRQHHCYSDGIAQSNMIDSNKSDILLYKPDNIA
jgi:hypothetical protein